MNDGFPPSATGDHASVVKRFEGRVEMAPDGVALIGTRWQPTYAELDGCANRVARAILERGGIRGDRVCVIMRHDAPLLAAVIGILKAARTVVVLNPGDPPERLRRVVEDSDPHLLFADSEHRNLANRFGSVPGGILCLEDLPMGGSDSRPGIAPSPDSVAFLLYTSGSMGSPKGVMRSHEMICQNAHRYSLGMGFGPTDRMALLASLSGGQGVSTALGGLLNGAAVCPFPTMERGVTGLPEWIDGQEITVLTASTSLFRHFARTLPSGRRFPSVRLVRLASEPAFGGDLRTFKSHFESGCSLAHTLSCSEAGNIACHLATEGDENLEGQLPVGRPAAGVEVLLLDERGHEVADGETGALAVRSRFLSPGYWRDPALTEACFSNAETGGARIFRGGDLVRRRPDGLLVFAGRGDRLVKVRGYRIELSEVELALSRLPAVERAIVLPRHDGGTENVRLNAFVVARSGHDCSRESLRAGLREIIPDYMIPTAFAVLPSIPLNAHGKVDQELLRRIDPVDFPSPGAAAAALLSPTEASLAEVWSRTFGRDAIGPDDDFFDLGGDSLSAAVVAAHVHAIWQVELELRVFYDRPVLSDLAAEVDRRQSSASVVDRTPLFRAPRDEPLPLSFQQERVWNFSQTPEASAGYTVSSSYRLVGHLDAAALLESLSHVMRRHEILRTTFEVRDGVPLQIIHPPTPVSLPFLDFSDSPDGDSQATSFLRRESKRPFDLATGPLLRFWLVRIRPDEHRLLRVNHHMISDGPSWKIFLRDLADTYDALRSGEPLPTPKSEPIQYADYAAWQRRNWDAAGESSREAVAWWRGLLSPPVAESTLPFQRPELVADAEVRDGLIEWGLDSAITLRLDDLARRERATFFGVRLAAFVALVAAETGESDVVIGTYVGNRRRPELFEVFGFFANIVTLRFCCDLSLSFRDWLREVSRVVNEIEARGEIPYEKLCEQLRASGVTPPEIRVIFSVSEQTRTLRFGEVELIWEERRMESMPWGFTLAIDQHNEHRRNRAAYDARNYDPAGVQRFLDRYRRLLRGIADTPGSPLVELINPDREPGVLRRDDVR